MLWLDNFSVTVGCNMHGDSWNNADFATVAPVLLSTGRLIEFLDSNKLILFSQTCKVARGALAGARKKHDLKTLLTAVVEGNEALAMRISRSLPELLLDPSAIVTDISGKEIKDLTPLQAAICAGDVEMVRKMIDVFYHEILRRAPLSVKPEAVIQSQFKAIYRYVIDFVNDLQLAQARQFRRHILGNIFTAINNATPQEVAFELNTPGQNHPNSTLNAALRNFREQFTAMSRVDQIFNPFYLFVAFSSLGEQFHNFRNINYRGLFWQQVIGYIQRHLPACYLQAFTQGAYVIVQNRIEKLLGNIDSPRDKSCDMRPRVELNNIGYEYAIRLRNIDPARLGGWNASLNSSDDEILTRLLETKISGLKDLFPLQGAIPDSRSAQVCRCVIS